MDVKCHIYGISGNFRGDDGEYVGRKNDWPGGKDGTFRRCYWGSKVTIILGDSGKGKSVLTNIITRGKQVADVDFVINIRLSYAISLEQIEKGIDRIENFLKELI